jgi:hypothetical protein
MCKWVRNERVSESLSSVSLPAIDRTPMTFFSAKAIGPGDDIPAPADTNKDGARPSRSSGRGLPPHVGLTAVIQNIRA